jgi:hypothetical protein
VVLDSLFSSKEKKRLISFLTDTDQVYPDELHLLEVAKGLSRAKVPCWDISKGWRK